MVSTLSIKPTSIWRADKLASGGSNLSAITRLADKPLVEAIVQQVPSNKHRDIEFIYVFHFVKNMHQQNCKEKKDMIPKY